MEIWIISALAFGYFIGCVHGSFVAQLMTGVNLKETGVRNAGASNATIVLGKKFGALVALIDIVKGFFAVALVGIFSSQAGLTNDQLASLLFLAGAAAIFGHNFPFYMRFKGGKGTATLIGVLFALDWRFGLLGLGLFLIVALATDYIVFGVLMLYITLFASTVWMDTIWPTVIAAVLFIMAVWKHLENFHRMKNKTEKRISAVFKKKKTENPL